MTMKIKTIENTPSSKQLAEILKNEFSDQYSYELYGFGKEKSIIVRKSIFVGAQISKRKNELIIEGFPNPSIATSFFAFLLPVILSIGAPVQRLFELFFQTP